MSSKTSQTIGEESVKTLLADLNSALKNLTCALCQYSYERFPSPSWYACSTIIWLNGTISTTLVCVTQIGKFWLSRITL